jgi:hypothetical protein
MHRITRHLIGRTVQFHGHDGQDYPAHVETVRLGYALITYPVWITGHGRPLTVTAYVNDPTRLDVIRRTA